MNSATDPESRIEEAVNRRLAKVDVRRMKTVIEGR